MLQGYLANYAASCRHADLRDPGTRHNVRTILIPKLQNYRRLLLEGLAFDRRSSRRLPKEVTRELLQEVGECRQAIRAATTRMIGCEPPPEEQRATVRRPQT